MNSASRRAKKRMAGRYDVRIIKSFSRPSGSFLSQYVCRSSYSCFELGAPLQKRLDTRRVCLLRKLEHVEVRFDKILGRREDVGDEVLGVGDALVNRSVHLHDGQGLVRERSEGRDAYRSDRDPRHPASSCSHRIAARKREWMRDLREACQTAFLDAREAIA